MNRETARYDSMLRKRVLDLHEKHVEVILRGVDERTYLKSVGYAQALKDVLGISDEVRKKIDED